MPARSASRRCGRCAPGKLAKVPARLGSRLPMSRGVRRRAKIHRRLLQQRDLGVSVRGSTHEQATILVQSAVSGGHRLLPRSSTATNRTALDGAGLLEAPACRDRGSFTARTNHLRLATRPTNSYHYAVPGLASCGASGKGARDAEGRNTIGGELDGSAPRTRRRRRPTCSSERSSTASSTVVFVASVRMGKTYMSEQIMLGWRGVKEDPPLSRRSHGASCRRRSAFRPGASSARASILMRLQHLNIRHRLRLRRHRRAQVARSPWP